ncbi:ABC transporter substrate-binding protein [Labrenzia sp. PHM005]|uniref:substrate-binding periplasmic protein n=1 Tax=Labrenzia sp. PHM005 TaxID=2590016 RepID=UPI001AD8D35A|nr:transporter substrate-binding domain-containing protein [Labrenzia sp. PHM005]
MDKHPKSSVPKVFGILAGLAQVCFANSDALADRVLFVQDNAYPPYMTVKDGAAGGLYAAILNEAKERLGSSELEILAVPWTRATVLVKNGSAQGLVGSYYKPQDRPWIRHWSEPIFHEEVSIFCRSGIAQPGWIYPDDYKGLLFGNVAGYRAPGDRFFELVAQGQIKLEEAQTTEQNLSKLSLERIDCYVVERVATEILIREKNITNVDNVGTASMEAAYIGYSDKWTGPEADAFIEAMDAVIKTMKKDGTIDRIVSRYPES